MTSLNRAAVMGISTLRDRRGNLSFIDGDRHLPFSIGQVHWLVGPKAGGWHADATARHGEEFAVVLAGALIVVLGQGADQLHVKLEEPDRGVYIPSGVERAVAAPTPDVVCLVLSNRHP